VRFADGGVGSVVVVVVQERGSAGSILRLLRLVERPRDFAIFSPSVEREIHWLLLTGPLAGFARSGGPKSGSPSPVVPPGGSRTTTTTPYGPTTLPGTSVSAWPP
jgi:hypothetical protein